MMMKSKIYSHVVEAGKKGDTIFLDIGCCSKCSNNSSPASTHMCAVGTDLRKLVLDGYPAINVVGSDIRQEYITSGYSLFQDKDSCKIRFFSADMFDVPVDTPAAAPTTPLADVSSFADLTDRVTHIYAGALYHLFDEAAQYDIAIKMASLLKRDSGAVIFGRHQGLDPEGLIDDVIYS